MPVFPFKPEQKVCPVDGHPLHVLNTKTRTIKAIGIGIFKAHYQTILPLFSGHFFGTLAGHFLRFVLVVKSEDQAAITPP